MPTPADTHRHFLSLISFAHSHTELLCPPSLPPSILTKQAPSTAGGLHLLLILTHSCPALFENLFLSSSQLLVAFRTLEDKERFRPIGYRDQRQPSIDCGVPSRPTAVCVHSPDSQQLGLGTPIALRKIKAS